MVTTSNRVFEVPATAYPGPPLRVSPPAPDLTEALDRTAAALAGRTVWHVNSTCDGGGVAELLYSFLRRHNALGVTTRWLVADAAPEFFAITKRMYFKLYGANGAPEPFTAAEHELYRRTTIEHAELALAYIQPGDIVVLHDPQTLGMASVLRAAGVRVIWQCHLGSLDPNPWTDEVWDFFGDDLFVPDGYVFSHPSYPPPSIESDRLRIIPPAIDPASPKNRPLEPAEVAAILSGIGLEPPNTAVASFGAEYGRTTPGWLARLATVEHETPLPPEAPVLLQVSRWDTLKDMAGVLTAFIEFMAPFTPAHLVLAGPDPTAIADDPGGVTVLSDMRKTLEGQPHEIRRRVHLVVTAGDDLEGTALVINALQWRAQVISQKSIKEGFGLTITEGMLKSKPVVAPAVGAIGTQVIDGQTGVLLSDPLNLHDFASAALRLLSDTELAQRLGAGGRQHCTERFLIDRQLRQYVNFYADLLQPAGVPVSHG